MIFGVSGQDGHFLSELYKSFGLEVIGIGRRGGSHIIGDVSSYEFVEGMIRHHKPTYIFHLAANSTTRHDALFDNHKTIGQGTLNILEAVRKWNKECKVFITGSGLQFKNVGKPIKESDQFDNSSSYCLARNYSVQAARYFRSIGIKVYVGYLFHHESPLRPFNHVSQIIVQAVKRISGGSNEIIELGDVSVRKEWGYAGDIAAGIVKLVNSDHVFEATIGTGIAYSIDEWVSKCFEIVGLDCVGRLHTRNDFKAEYPLLLSNPTTINSLGWTPECSFDELARRMIYANSV
jgi:GDPmannose 4,6-dehydratase